MKIRFTRHANQKLILVREAGFLITEKYIISVINNPVKIEDRYDRTIIVTAIYDNKHVIRVVNRVEDDIIIVITFYPGRRKAYEI